MEQLTGVLDKIRVIKYDPLMIRFTLTTIHKSYCCIVARKELATKILMLEDGKYNVVVNGHYNSRNQVVVSLFKVRNYDHITKLIGF
ncbi:hypothetical protein [Enterococcus hirae]|uniref:hypothetical protein n=1 Tax=Enterococcus hirae TaxID=1354 RepID=UPI0019F8C8B0|nr:hypothetical protein [Enterococcus faecium]